MSDIAPTPWRSESHGIVDAEGKSVAIITPRLEWPDMAAARRHGPLLAAAPDLLAALKRVRDWINTSVPIGTEAATTILGVTSEAIAKAEGRTP